MGDISPGPALHAAAIWRIDDSLVLVRRGDGAADGLWDLPRGALRAGETAAEALVRAVIDDTGAEVVCGPFAGWSEAVDVEEPAVTLHFEAVPLDASSPPADSSGLHRGPSGLEVRRFQMWELSELRLVAGLAEFLADAELLDLLI